MAPTITVVCREAATAPPNGAALYQRIWRPVALAKITSAREAPSGP